LRPRALPALIDHMPRRVAILLASRVGFLRDNIPYFGGDRWKARIAIDRCEHMGHIEPVGLRKSLLVDLPTPDHRNLGGTASMCLLQSLVERRSDVRPFGFIRTITRDHDVVPSRQRPLRKALPRLAS